MKNNTYHTDGTVPKSNKKIVERHFNKLLVCAYKGPLKLSHTLRLSLKQINNDRGPISFY